ncbi:MAG TPA: hypothetical protein VJX67_20840 [Blastocatellia bacterium]|nr:hypothetical protein [Blastocatellia bacterium]
MNMSTAVTFWVIFGIVTAVIYSRKGDAFAGFLIGVLFGPLGILYAIFSKGERTNCPYCRELVRKDAVVCPHCRCQITSNDPLSDPPNGQPQDTDTPEVPSGILAAAASYPGASYSIGYKAGELWASLPSVARVCIVLGPVLLIGLLYYATQRDESSNGYSTPSSSSIPLNSRSATEAPPTVDPSSSVASKPPEEQPDADTLELAKVKEKVQRDYPDDYVTQSGVYDMQLDAFRYMKSIQPSKLKEKVERDYPHDYVTQKGVYNMQIEAQEYMDSLPPSRLKQRIQRDYPNDFVTQKGVYDMQIDAGRGLN